VVRPVSGRIVIATHNAGKLREFQELLRFYPSEIVSAGSLGLPSPEETGTTFTENALLKARAAALATGNLALADDSGVCVTALNNQPGIYSARWAGANKNFRPAMQRIHDELANNPDRSAHFMCVLALVWPTGEQKIFEGRIDGTIVWPPRGDFGHGYDPIFIPQGDTRTFGEITDAEKNRISHRAKAAQKLIAFFQAH